MINRFYSFITFHLCFAVYLQIVMPSAVFANLTVSPAQLNSALAYELISYPEELLGLDWYDVDTNHQEKWLAAVYHGLGIHPLWVNGNGPTDKAKQILSALKAVDADGLHPNDYGVTKIDSFWESRTANHLARLDIDLTLGLLGYIHDMQEGRLAPKLKNPKLFDQAGNFLFDPVTALFEASNNNMAAYLADLAPNHHYYRTLKQELKHYRNIAAEGGWPKISSGDTLHPGTADVRIPALRQLLVIIGDLTPTADLTHQVYDDQLVMAVKRFQGRHGLEVDGVVGKGTTAVFNIPVAQRIQQILINMERWRWIKHKLGSKFVLVDIAGFDLQGVVEDEVLLEMRVIVGRMHHETPIFSDTIKYIEFNPFWNITPSIARNEMLGKLRENSNYLASKHIKLFSSWQADGHELNPKDMNWNEISRNQISRFKLRQEPGPWNALGVVKFVFPNKYSVYLHDTPVHSLFQKTNRAFSHGCIRLSMPEQLAQFLLADSDTKWTEEIIHQVVESEKRKIVRLNKPIPVHLIYQTAWVDREGRLHFSRDLYGRDRKLANALFAEE